jgi:MFS family permease
MAQPGTDTWRWIFWMNVPLCAMILVLLYVCLQFNRPRLPSYVQELKSLDFIGMALLAASTVLILLGFTWAGTKYSWQAAQILVPILGGISGLVAFWIFERSSYPTRPLVPAYMLTQRTAILISAVTFCYAITLYWIIFTVPTYFQAVQLSTAAAAGLKTLPFAIAIIPVCVVAGILLTRWGRYKPMHVVGCAVTAIAVGLMSSMDRDTHIALWILYLVLGALGMGTLMNTMLPGFQATLTSETEQAAGTAAWNFIRSFGYIWGFGASTAIFNSVASAHADMVSDVPLQTELRAGRTLAFAVAAQIKSFGDPVSDQLHSVLTLSIQRTLLLGIMFPCLALLFSLFEQEIALKTTIESDFGLTEDGTRSGSVETTWSKKSESV